MLSYSYTAIVTLLALLVYIWMIMRVPAARRKVDIWPPAMTGDPLLERTIRVQANTLEWLPVFLPALWLFAISWDDKIAAGLGVVWILGRIWYAIGYSAEASKRGPGFGIQFLATAALLLGALGRVIWMTAVA
jgi:uncharacterized membrane protein YecN with MAPEG domain